MELENTELWQKTPVHLLPYHKINQVRKYKIRNFYAVQNLRTDSKYRGQLTHGNYEVLYHASDSPHGFGSVKVNDLNTGCHIVNNKKLINGSFSQVFNLASGKLALQQCQQGTYQPCDKCRLRHRVHRRAYSYDIEYTDSPGLGYRYTYEELESQTNPDAPHPTIIIKYLPNFEYPNFFNQAKAWNKTI